MFCALVVVAFEFGTVWPVFDAEAVLLVVQPLAFVAGTVEMRIDAEPTGLIIDPLPIIHISFSMHESSLSVGHSILPEAIVSGSVRPYLNASAAFGVCFDQPLTLVDGSGFHLGYGTDFACFAIFRGALSPVERSQTLYDILHVCV